MAMLLAGILLVSMLCHVGMPLNSRITWRKTRYVKPWLRGPNICALEEVMSTGKQYYSSCLTYNPTNICGKRTLIKYYCCNGYESTGDGQKGCLGVKPVRNLVSTASHLGLYQLTKYIKDAGLEDKFTEPGPYTMFVPERRVYQKLSDDTKMLLATKDQSQNLIRMHVAEGRYFNKELTEGKEIPSIYYYQDEGLLRINNYNNGVKTVNCVRLTLTDQVATNGVIHLTEKVIEPYPNRGSIMDIILRDDRFGELATALIVSDIGNELRDSDETFTLFAPTDKAFRSAPPEIINRILGDKELVKKLLRYHQLPVNLCSAAILGPVKYHSREGQLLNLSCDVDDSISVNGVPVAETDIVAFNGVVHVIDELLIPDSVKSLGDIITELDMGKFIEYAQQAGMQSILSGEAPGNYTIFVPRPEAFAALSEDDMMRLQTDTVFVKETLKYHVVPEVLATQDMNEGQVMDTLYKAPLRAHVYQNGYGVNSAKILRPNHVASNGVVHIVDRVLFPPVKSAMDIIKQDARLTTLNSLLKVSGLNSRLDGNGHYTLFAPSNRAFSKLPREQVEMLTGDDQQLRQALGYHLLPKQVFSSGISKGLTYRYHTLAKEWLHLKKEKKDDPILVDGLAAITEADIETTSGVIHIVDNVLKCPCVPGFHEDEEDDRARG